MKQSQIYKVLSILEKRKVKALLIGGQATIIYGAAEFSRDIDFAVLLNDKNLQNIKFALKDLKAKQIYYPPLKKGYLERGHACHFRCGLPELRGFRVDVIARLRGCDDFNELWKRKKTIKSLYGVKINIIGLQDLVQSKKTQRDKDWLMLKRLVEADILKNRETSIKKAEWWFRECRTPELLIELVKRYRGICKKISKERYLLKWAEKNNVEQLEGYLHREEKIEREKDKIYWKPLRRELENLRHGKIRSFG